MKQASQQAAPRRHGSALALVLLGLLASPLLAIEGQKGDFTWNWDNTVSYGLLYRVTGPDQSLIGVAAGGSGFSVNGDDGNQNYSGLSSNAFKWTSELQFSFRNFGGFVRSFAFYDYENQDQDRDRTELSDAAKKRVGDGRG